MVTRFPSRALLAQNKRKIGCLFFAVVGAIFLGYCILLLVLPGNPSDILRLPPYRDSSTPATQNGVRLVKVQYVSNWSKFDYESPFITSDDGLDDICGASVGVFIEMPQEAQTQNADSNHVCGSNSLDCFRQVTVTAYASDGTVNNDIEWYFLYPYSSRILFCRIPSGYAANVKSVDLRVEDASHHIGVWRIAHLPQTQRIISTSDVRSQVTQQNMTITAHAGRAHVPNPITGRPTEVIVANIQAETADHSKKWIQIHPLDSLPDTMPSSHSPVSIRAMYSSSAGLALSGSTVQQVRTGWSSANQNVRVRGRVEAFEIYDEPVTFHNIEVIVEKSQSYDIFQDVPMGHLIVKQTQTCTTPSGVKVTLPAQKEPQRDGYGIAFDLRYDTPNYNCVLPYSALYQQWHTPIEKIEAAFPRPLDVDSEYSYGQQHLNTIMVQWPHVKSGKLKDFTFFLRQRIPMGEANYDLIVPVEKTIAQPVVQTYIPSTPVEYMDQGPPEMIAHRGD